MVTAPWVGSIHESRPGATRHLIRLVTRDVAKLRPGRVADIVPKRIPQVVGHRAICPHPVTSL